MLSPCFYILPNRHIPIHAEITNSIGRNRNVKERTTPLCYLLLTYSVITEVVTSIGVLIKEIQIKNSFDSSPVHSSVNNPLIFIYFPLLLVLTLFDWSKQIVLVEFFVYLFRHHVLLLLSLKIFHWSKPNKNK